ncbi:abortive infection system antitoxin AbiGi family protein [Vallitalea okinawensis]|uniref:abortive infection system antitoxin AbiGi family protein n=1 Tax=Vallitalea okinawensis TaxID=2078660 RepID=UPI000CFD72E5|nr:abortive infection system antitoxin AbiGi family protein [Vallitalea okinawensis]
MGRISAGSVFHFTDSFEKLRDIIENNCFKPRCVIEKRKQEEIAIPMVCFCDLPLSQMGEHIKKYGNYGVGLRKEWAAKQSISPVMYEAINPSKENAFDVVLKKANNIGDETLLERMKYFSWYIKSYDGYDTTKDFVQFYNEREWRYIPPYEALCEASYFPSIFSKNLKEIQSQFNHNQSKNFNLTFQLEDITYFFISYEWELESLASIMTLDKDQEMSLLSRVIWTKDLLEDF